MTDDNESQEHKSVDGAEKKNLEKTEQLLPMKNFKKLKKLKLNSRKS